jgi:hypothetical protein
MTHLRQLLMGLIPSRSHQVKVCLQKWQYLIEEDGEVCQRARVVLVTANRHDAGPESLEATFRHHTTPQNLPAFTLANDQRVLRDRQYTETVADRLIEALFDIDSYRGTGRIYLP